MMREDFTQKLMYGCAAGAAVSLAFVVALKFATHAKAQPKSEAAQTLTPSASPPDAAAATTPSSVPASAAVSADDEAAEPPPTVNGQALTKEEASDFNKLEGFLEPFIYDLVNRRDPFLPFAEYVAPESGPQARALSPAQRYELDQLKLVGVMWDIKEPKAMFMDPESEIITLGRDEGIGNHSGYVASIREGEVVVVEAIRKRGDVVYKTRVLHLER